MRLKGSNAGSRLAYTRSLAIRAIPRGSEQYPKRHCLVQFSVFSDLQAVEANATGRDPVDEADPP